VRGIAYERSDQFPLAEKDFLRALDLAPNQPQVLNYLGYSWVDKGMNLDRALGMIEKAIEGSPNDGYIIDSLGWAYFQQGRYPDALRELKRAVEKAKEDPVIFDHLGEAYAKNGFDEDALQAWEKSLTLDPNAEGVAKKVQDAKSRLRRVQGERSKASQ